MGLTSVLNSFIVIWGNFRNLGPSFIFNFMNALSALSFRSFRPECISPVCVILNPRYFVFPGCFNWSPAKEKSFAYMSSWFIKDHNSSFIRLTLSPLISEKLCRLFNIFWRLCSDSDKIKTSSVQIKHEQGSFGNICEGLLSSSSRMFRRSVIYMLNKRGA